MGNKEARSLLVRDRNKIVAIAAVTSPKITDNELLAIAQSRNVSDEVIRIDRQQPRGHAPLPGEARAGHQPAHAPGRSR